MRRRGGGAMVSQIWKELGGKVPGRKVQETPNNKDPPSKRENGGKRAKGEGRKRDGNKRKREKKKEGEL